MKQHLVIGRFVFSISNNTQISGVSRLSKGRFKEIELISKSITYKTAAPLEEMVISCQWVSQSINDSIEPLRAMLDTPQQVSNGQGTNLGRWIIKAIQADGSQMTTDGIAQVTKLTITLLEAPYDS